MLATLLALAGCQTPGKKPGTAPATAEQGGTSSTAPSAPPAAPDGKAAAVGFFIAQTDNAAGLMEVKLTDGAIYVQRQPVLTRADLTEAAALVDRQGKNFVGLRFSESGAKKLADISQQNVGKLLAVVIDNQLVAAPRIAEPLNRGVLAFGVDSAQSASSIAARIRGDQGGADGAGAGAGAPAAAPAAMPQPATGGTRR
jgi:hypothetical protein